VRQAGRIVLPMLARVILTVALMTGSAEAAEGPIFNGLGVLSCGTWTDARRDRQAFGYEQWVLGFLSGIGYTGWMNYNPLNGLDANAVLAWIDNFCQAHPLDRISTAASLFVFEHPR
jgi:hypothetical protein